MPGRRAAPTRRATAQPDHRSAARKSTPARSIDDAGVLGALRCCFLYPSTNCESLVWSEPSGFLISTMSGISPGTE